VVCQKPLPAVGAGVIGMVKTRLGLFAQGKGGVGVLGELLSGELALVELEAWPALFSGPSNLRQLCLPANANRDCRYLGIIQRACKPYSRKIG